jgi:hypothetical protein
MIEPELCLDREAMVIYSIHIREVLEAIPTQFDKPPKDDPIKMLLYIAMIELENLAAKMDEVVAGEA